MKPKGVLSLRITASCGLTHISLHAASVPLTAGFTQPDTGCLDWIIDNSSSPVASPSLALVSDPTQRGTGARTRRRVEP